jgi:hypothetical protein
MTDRDWEKELATIGEAIGKSYKTRDNNQLIIVGDYRFSPSHIEALQPLLGVVDYTGAYCVTKEGRYSSKDLHDFDIVGPWTEPKSKVKKYQAVLLQMNEEYAEPFITEEYYQTLFDVVECNLDYEVLKFPYGEAKEIEEV